MIKILLIEDDSAIRHVTAKFLQLHQYVCFEAKNGNEAIILLQQNNIAIVVCDINLPDMSGIDILNFIRNHSEFCSIPFIAISAYSSLEDINQSFDSGADDYLTKPFQYRVLLDSIDRLLKSK
jgi:sigma-B regulation protein RsbU (phosphoserine phosphatase)